MYLCLRVKCPFNQRGISALRSSKIFWKTNFFAIRKHLESFLGFDKPRGDSHIANFLFSISEWETVGKFIYYVRFALISCEVKSQQLCSTALDLTTRLWHMRHSLSKHPKIWLLLSTVSISTSIKSAIIFDGVLLTPPFDQLTLQITYSVGIFPTCIFNNIREKRIKNPRVELEHIHGVERSICQTPLDRSFEKGVDILARKMCSK